MTNDDIFGIGDDAYDDTDVESTWNNMLHHKSLIINYDDLDVESIIN
jgi:hypothetical protein